MRHLVGATYSGSEVMNNLLVLGLSLAFCGGGLFVTLRVADRLGGLCEEHAPPGYELAPPTETRFPADIRVGRCALVPNEQLR